MSDDQETLRPLTRESGADGSISAETRLTPIKHKTRGVICVRPSTVVPVIFVPGIMGSNLRDKTTKESVWNINSTVAILLQWIFRSARTRQTKLSVEDAEVDESGKWYGRSATVSDAKVAKARGQGGTSRAFYGDFVRWLDDELNSEEKHGKTSHVLATEHPGFPSPWDVFVDGEQKDQTWGAEKPFHPITQDESNDIWDNFFCPVYAFGYNWLDTNGNAGIALAGRIEQIIQAWNDTDCGFQCEQVILVSHSMGGLVTRAAAHPAYGNAENRILGIVHGEMPANGAAAAYHHCRNGYDGLDGWVLGRTPGQVSAVFANSPGAMELLPNHQYEQNGKKGWLKVQIGNDPDSFMDMPLSDPYKEIYGRKDVWWRLMDPSLINPARKPGDAWDFYKKTSN